MASIRERQTKKGLVYDVDYIGAGGQRVRRTFASPEAAEMAKNRLLTERDEQKIFGKKRIERIKFNKIVEQFLRFSKANKEKKTHASHITSTNKLSDFFRDQYLDSITLRDIEQYKLWRLETVKPTSLNHELTCLKYILHLAKQWDMYSGDLHERIKKLKEPPGRMRYLLKDEAARLINAATVPHLKVFYVVALNTGMRRGEILNLMWVDIDFPNKMIIIQDSKSGRKRNVPMNGTLSQVLWAWKMQSTGERVFAVNDVKRAHATACRNAGIKDFRVHDCRHTAASWMAVNGTPLPVIGQILGHQSLEMTLRYSHFCPDLRMVAVDMIDDWPEICL